MPGREHWPQQYCICTPTAGLHKGLRPANVLFFPRSTAPSPRSLEEPYLRGYKYTRRDEPGEISNEPSNEPAHASYRHPNAQGAYQRVVRQSVRHLRSRLLCSWKSHIGSRSRKSIEKSMGGKKISSSLLKTVRVSLLDDTPTGFLQNVRFLTGSGFASVISVCIGGTFENTLIPAAVIFAGVFRACSEAVAKTNREGIACSLDNWPQRSCFPRCSHSPLSVYNSNYARKAMKEAIIRRFGLKT